MNLCTNAWHAMQDTGGTLTIILKQVTVDSKLAKYHPNLKVGEYACLSINDTGIGMSEKALEHIFEPFFTTKKSGHGLGLGLTISDRIVRDFGGQIILAQSSGGARFEFTLDKIV